MDYPVIVCGTVAFDSIFTHDKSFIPYFQNVSNEIGVNLIAQSHHKYLGGTAANVAYNLSLLNIGCRIMASVGNDFYEFKCFLNNHNINTDWVSELKDELTSTCVIFNDIDNNHIDMFSPGPMYNDKYLSLHKKDINGVLLVIITPTDIQSMVMRSKECNYFNIPYIFDPGIFIERFDINDLISCITNSKILTMNEKEFFRLLKYLDVNINDILKLNSTIVITKGKNGSILYSNGEVANIPAVEPQNIANTIGAGDAYKAGLAFGMLNDLPIVDCCKIGSTVSSFNVEAYGSMNHTFSRKTLIERYKKHFSDYDNTIKSMLAMHDAWHQASKET